MQSFTDGEAEVSGCFWPQILQAFIRGLPRGSLVADLGCGQGLCNRFWRTVHVSAAMTCYCSSSDANQSNNIVLAALSLLMQQAMARICKRLSHACAAPICQSMSVAFKATCQGSWMLSGGERFRLKCAVHEDHP